MNVNHIYLGKCTVLKKNIVGNHNKHPDTVTKLKRKWRNGMFKFKKIEKRLILKSLTESLAYLNQKKNKNKTKKPLQHIMINMRERGSF